MVHRRSGCAGDWVEPARRRYSFGALELLCEKRIAWGGWIWSAAASLIDRVAVVIIVGVVVIDFALVVFLLLVLLFLLFLVVVGLFTIGSRGRCRRIQQWC